ncbi:MAG: UDP-2,3-diacylglucosamine diphosphatase [Ignavibacteriales bacterium]|nr:UDP-2,3-diacylglucosamine diphosphatase [Ignavibacteriales bacterium]
MASSRRASRRKTYFFSDAHLGLGSREEEREKEQRVVDFLSLVLQDAEQLFIVGDLFDFWFEYKSVVPKGYFRLFSKIAELRDAGVRVSFLAGNHDFWLKGYFRDELGMQVFLEPIERVIRGKRFLIHHGDGLLKNDTGYKILKSILRNRVNMFLFSLVHPDIAGAIARWSSRKSRQHTSKRPLEEGDMIHHAGQKIGEGFDYVVMGHNHLPQFRKIGNGVYVNLGDWISENTYAVFDGKKLELKKWSPRPR